MCGERRVGHMFPIVFLLCLHWEKGRGATPYWQTTSAPGDGRWSFDDALATLMQGRIFQGCYLSVFDNSETLFASLIQGSEKLSKVYWLAKFTLVNPQTQTPSAKAWLVEISSLLHLSSSDMALDFFCWCRLSECHVSRMQLGMLSTA